MTGLACIGVGCSHALANPSRIKGATGDPKVRARRSRSRQLLNATTLASPQQGISHRTHERGTTLGSPQVQRDLQLDPAS